jgi:hypothetical protein
MQGSVQEMDDLSAAFVQHVTVVVVYSEDDLIHTYMAMFRMPLPNSCDLSRRFCKEKKVHDHQMWVEGDRSRTIRRLCSRLAVFRWPDWRYCRTSHESVCCSSRSSDIGALFGIW